MNNEKNKMRELQNDLIDVLNKHGLLVLVDGATLELSPIRIDVSSGLGTRDVTFSFREAIRLTNEELKENIDKYGLIMELRYEQV